MTERSWEKWAVGEGLMKTASAVLQKVAGIAINVPALATAYSLIIGIAQFLSGVIGKRSDLRALMLPIDQIIWPITFGFFASIANVLGPVAFMYDADLTARTLLVLCSVIPGAFIGMAFFGEKYDGFQWLGILVFLASAWAIMDFPVWDSAGGVPVWVWITLVVTLTNAINEGVTKKAALKLTPWVNNFWIGASTIFWSGLGLVVFSAFGGMDSANVSDVFLAVAVGTGVIVVFMTAFKLMAYKDNAWIALKKILMNGTYLIGAAILGLIFFGESVTYGKVIGVALFLLALLLSDKKARGFVWGKVAGSTAA